MKVSINVILLQYANTADSYKNLQDRRISLCDKAMDIPLIKILDYPFYA